MRTAAGFRVRDKENRMAEVALAFIWHQHQPYYPDDVAGENPMPWVRQIGRAHV